MSDEQFAALGCMFMFGLAALPVFADQEDKKILRWLKIWVAFWWTPVCVTVWIAGVFG